MMTKAQIKDIRERVQTSLNEIGEELGMELKMGRITFNADGFRCQLKGRWEDLEPEVCTDYDKNRWGAMPDRNSVIKFDGSLYTVYGYKKSARKRPIIIKDLLTDKQYVISERALKEAEVIK